MRTFSTKAAAATAGTALALAASGVAFAYWTGGGAGEGTAATGTGASNLTLTQTSVLTPLVPGAPAQTLQGTVTNNNTAESTYVTQVTASIKSVSGTGCDPSDYTLANAVMPVSNDLSAGETAPFTGATLAFNNKAGVNQDGCKGATVTITYTAS